MKKIGEKEKFILAAIIICGIPLAVILFILFQPDRAGEAMDWLDNLTLY